MDKNSTQGGVSDDVQGKSMKRKLNSYFYFVVIGTVLSMSSTVALQTLQTSINIEGNKGAIAVTAAYTGGILYGMLVAPAMLRRFGIGVSLVLADISYGVYSLSNFYPELYVLLIGAIASSVARATLIPVTSAACIELAEVFNRYGSQTKSYYVNRYQSRFFAIFLTIGIVGNSVSFAILYAGDRSPEETADELYATSSSFTNDSTPYTQSDIGYSYCGVNDCHDPDVVEGNIDQYVPPNKSSINILVSVTTSMCFLAALTHGMIYPGVGIFRRRLGEDVEATSLPQSRRESTSSSQVKIEKCEKNTYHVNENFEDDFKNNNGTTKITQFQDNSKSQLNEADYGKELTQMNGVHQEISNGHDDEKQTSHESYLTTLKKTGVFFLKFEAILLNLTPMRNGMMIGLMFSDITRAYASCVAGVEMTSLIAMTFGTIGIPTSLAYGFCVAKVGRNPIMAVGYLIEMTVYVGCYIWEPDPNSIVFVYLIFMGNGVVNGIQKPLISTVYNKYFPHEKHIAVNAWNLSVSVGIGLQYGLSTVMCTRDKLILTASFSSVSVIAYGLNELLHHRKKVYSKDDDTELAAETKL